MTRRTAGSHTPPGARGHRALVLAGDLETSLCGGVVECAECGALPDQAALAPWRTPIWSVWIELHVALAGGPVILTAWHRQAGGRVLCVATIDRRTFELSWTDVAGWPTELARLVDVDAERLAGVAGRSGQPGHPGPRQPSGSVGLPDDLEVPWELLVASGEAVREGRPDLVPPLVAEHGLPPDRPTAHWLCALQDASRGRLCATVAGPGPRAGHGVGLVQWALFADGWRALEPGRRPDGVPTARIRRVPAAGLGSHVGACITRLAA